MVHETAAEALSAVLCALPLLQLHTWVPAATAEKSSCPVTETEASPWQSPRQGRHSRCTGNCLRSTSRASKTSRLRSRVEGKLAHRCTQANQKICGHVSTTHLQRGTYADHHCSGHCLEQHILPHCPHMISYVTQTWILHQPFSLWDPLSLSDRG